jgi:hypothetical protein
VPHCSVVRSASVATDAAEAERAARRAERQAYLKAKGDSATAGMDRGENDLSRPRRRAAHGDGYSEWLKSSILTRRVIARRDRGRALEEARHGTVTPLVVKGGDPYATRHR